VPTFDRSIVVAVPRAPLFDLMQDYGRRLDWDEFLSEARLVGGAERAAPGVRALCVDRGGRAMETEYVTVRPPERVAVRMTRGPWMFSSFAGSWIYEALSAGETRVTFRYHVEARPRALRRLLSPIVAAVFAREMERRLGSLRRRIEALYRRSTQAAGDPSGAATG
jgi:ribosome-associated toxin RatA of RatAB toxin-antitoxin module